MLDNRCEATTNSGRRCKVAPMTGARFCFHHNPDPDVAAERQEARRRGGLSLHYGRGGPDRPDTELRTVADVLTLLEVGFADILSRPASIERSRAIGYLAGVALRALETGELEERLEALERRLNMEKIA